jgi:hypothetical protein
MSKILADVCPSLLYAQTTFMANPNVKSSLRIQDRCACILDYIVIRFLSSMIDLNHLYSDL